MDTQSASTNTPAASRGSVTPVDELRQKVASWVLAVLEADAGNFSMERHELVSLILTSYATKRVHAAHRLKAVLEGNPLPVEVSGYTPSLIDRLL